MPWALMAAGAAGREAGPPAGSIDRGFESGHRPVGLGSVTAVSGLSVLVVKWAG